MIIKDFRRWFTSFPAWRCPRCGVGTLIEQENERQVVEPAYSTSQKAHPAWEPDWITYRFVAKFACSNGPCGECVFVIGEGSVDQDEDGWGDYFEPKSMFPPITPVPLHENWPTEVQDGLILACTHMWSDPGAAANRLRTTVEALLDHLNVKKTTLVSIAGQPKKKRTKIGLHDRIVTFRSRNADAADLLLALKWLGNAGSHSDMRGITRDDVLGGMEILEHVLTLLFDDKGTRVMKLAKSINKKRGPVPKKRRIIRIRKKA